MKKITAFILVILMVLAAFAGCGESADGDTTAATAEPGTEEIVIDGPVHEIKIGDTLLSEFSVMLPAEPASAVKNAAKDFIYLIKRAFGISLPLISETDTAEHAIILDKTGHDTEELKAAREEIEYDGYAIIEDGGNLYVSGTMARGTANGLYVILEDYCGYKFYTDTFLAVKSANIKDIPAKEHTIFSPVFKGRFNWSRAYEYNFAYHKQRTRSASVKYGGAHNLDKLAGITDGSQPCLSDEKIYETVLENFCKTIDKKPNQTVFPLNQNDGGKFCECDECRAKNIAAGGEDVKMGSYLLFVNRIADEVKKRYPDRDIEICIYAYHDTTKCPVQDFEKPRDNVVIGLCMMNGTCFTHAFNDPDCEINVENYENILNWSKFADKLSIYDYTFNFANQDKVSYNSVGPNLNVLYDNIQMFAEIGCVGILDEGDHIQLVGEFTELRNYLINSLLWNPYMSREEYYALWDEFMTDYYGDAAPYLREYMDLMNETSLRKGLTDWNGHSSVYTDASIFYAPIVDGKKDYTVINKCTELWNKAFECTLSDTEYAHLEKSSIHFRVFESMYTNDKNTKSYARNALKHLSDKYTLNLYTTLPEAGSIEGVSADIPSEGLEFKSYKDGTAYVCDIGTFEGGMLVIPAEYNGQKVVTIGECSLVRSTNLVEVHVPEGIKNIGVFAFRGCKNLQAVYLPASLEFIGFGAFGVNSQEDFICGSLKDIYYAGNTEQWHELFDDYNGRWNNLLNCTVHCSDGDIELKK